MDGYIVRGTALVGTIMFLVLAALIAAIATTQEDYQQFQAPLMILIVSGFYIGIFLPMAGADGLIKIAAFIPVFTPLVAPIAFATGVLSVLQALIALLILAVFTYILMRLVTPVYKVAILSYEETKFFKRIGFYFKKAFANRRNR